MRVVILVPRRADGGHRDRLWDTCRPRWEKLHPDWDIVEGHHDEGPFNRSAAINLAARKAGDWDVAVIIDSDIAIDPAYVTEAVRRAHEYGRVTWAHKDWRGISRRGTEEALADPRRLLRPDPSYLGPIEKHNPISWSCCIAVPRDAWDAIGGFDERFRGWGWEDIAFASQAMAHGDDGNGSVWDGGTGISTQRVAEGSVYHLWHPRSPGIGTGSRDSRGRFTVEAVVNAQLGRRYMVALRRDHGYHDRATPSDEDDLQRDIANLHRDDERIAREAERLGVPAYRDWWPTLDELRTGTMPSQRVALVMHSGGDADHWEARSGYLRRALQSLDEHVGFPFVRRVIRSDWGEERRADMEAIAQAHGYELIGGDRLGYTGSMSALWKWIRRQDFDHVFVTEDDFLMDRPVDIGAMSDVLMRQRHLAQIALLRHPFYEPERDPATILGHPRAEFEEHSDGDRAWLEHRRFFTLNPMLMRRSLANLGWPPARHSEAVFGRRLFRADKYARAAFWGRGEAWITHIGDERAGTGY